MITKNTIYQNNEQLLDFVNTNFFWKKWNFLIQIFTWISDINLLKNITKLLKDNLDNVHIIWTTTSWEIMNWKNYDWEIVISISLFEKSEIKSFLLEYLEWNEKDLCKAFCDSYITNDDKILILFTDWLNTIWVDFMRYLYSRFPKLVIAWAKAWDNKKFDNTIIFDWEKFVDNWICWVLISWDSLVCNNEYSFGWSRVWKLLTVTKADKNRLYEIDGISAYDYYKSSLWEEIVKNLPHIWWQFPLIIMRNWVKVAREIIKRHSDWSFSLSWDIKENEIVQIWCWQINTILKTDKKIITKTLNWKPIESIFVYSCSWRKSFMWKYLDKEVWIFNCFWESSWFYWYWVFFHSDTYNFVLSETMTILALSENASIKSKIIDENCKCFSNLNKINDISDIWFYWAANLLKKISDELNQINSDLVTTLQAKQLQINNAQSEFNKSYVKLVDNINVPICMLDSNRKFIYVNSEFSNLFWYSIEDIKWVLVLELFDNPWKKLALKHIELYRSKWLTSTYKVNIYHKEWFLIPTKLTWMIFHWTMSVLVIYDIREIERLKEKAESLEKMNQIKSDFVSVASHELRTPMTSIKWYLSMIKDWDYWIVSPELSKVIDIILQSTERQIDLINDMLNLNKLEANKLEFKKELFILNNLIEEVVEEFYASSRSKNIKLSVEIDDEKIKLKSDWNKLKQVFLNLIWNSLKFTPVWWEIKIIATKLNNRFVRINIQDNWIWISPKDHKKIFEKFTQVDSPLNRQHSWTWLWIPIAAMIIKNLWWKLNLNSDLWKWCDFYFNLELFNEE